MDFDTIGYEEPTFIRILKNLLIEAICVALFIVYGYMKGWDAITFYKFEGFGAKISLFGLLWMVGSFFRLSTGWGGFCTSFGLALCIFVFGATLDSTGLSSACLTVGFLLLFMAFLCVFHVGMRGGLAIAGALMLLLSKVTPDVPTETPEATEERIGECPDIRWYIQYTTKTKIGNKNYHNLEITGTLNDVKAAIAKIKRDLEADENEYLYREIDYGYMHIPDKWCREVGKGTYNWLDKKVPVPMRQYIPEGSSQ